MKPITKFQTVPANDGKKNKFGFAVYVGAYVDPKTAERAKMLFTQKGECENGV